MNRWKKTFIVFTVILVAALIVYPFLPSGAQTIIRNLPEKSASYVSGNISGTYASTEKVLPALPDSLKNEDTLLIAYKSKYRMQLYYKGKLQKTYIIGLGQEPIGHKQQQGDNRTPEGDYRIIEKAVGPFTGANPYLGNRWMRINYPNSADAKAGLAKEFITQSECDKIISANKKGTEPLKTTKLGGGIGIHGWYGTWPGDDEQDITWGCISMQNVDVEDVYDRIGLQTRIIINP
jgi:hypothetical protein